MSTGADQFRQYSSNAYSGPSVGDTEMAKT